MKDYQVRFLANINFQCQAFSCPKHADSYSTYVFSNEHISAPLAKWFPLQGCSQNRTQVYGLAQEAIPMEHWNNIPLVAVVLPSPDPTGAQDSCNGIGVSRDLVFDGLWRAHNKKPLRVAFVFLTRGYSFKKHYKRELVQNQVSPAAVSNCFPYFEQDLAMLNPDKILMCGVEAGRLFFGDGFSIPEFRRRKGLKIQLRGKFYDTQVTYNPHLCTTMPPFIKTLWDDCLRLFVEPSSFLQRGTYKLLMDVKEVDAYLDFLEQWDDFISTDTETENLNRMYHNRLATVQFATDTNIGYVIPIQHKDTPFSPDELKHIQGRLFNLYNNKAKTAGWVAHSAKFENTIFQMHLNTMMDSSFIYDTQSGAYLLDETRSERKADIPRGGGMYSLKQLARDNLGFEDYDKTTLGFRQEGQLFNMPLNDLADYGGMDVYVGLALHHWNMEEAVRQKYLPQFMRLNQLYYGPATRLIAEIERNGFKVDLQHLRKLNSKFGPLEAKLANLLNTFRNDPVYQDANKRIVSKQNAGIRVGATGKIPWMLDVDKPDVKKFLFFEVMGLEPVSFTDKTGLPAVDDTFYKEYAEDHKEVQYMQDYEEAKKMKNTFVDKLLSRADPRTGEGDAKYDQRIRSNISYSQLVTGRWAMSGPNLGQIPRAEEGGDDNEFLVRKAVKDIFTVDKHHALIQVDYKVNEVRWAGILSKDEALAKIFNDAAKLTAEACVSGDPEKIKIAAILEDIHKNTASLMFNKPPEEVGKKERQIAKNITFGILFQQSAKALAVAVNLTLEEAEQHIANFFSKMSGVAQWIEQMKVEAQTKGYVEAPHGRRRRFWAFHLPESFAGRKSLINRNLRQCVNAPIQGIASDAAMIGGAYSLFEYIRKNKRKWIIQNVVHDSCLVQVPKEEVAEFLLMCEQFFVTEAMERMTAMGVNFNLPLGCDAEVGLHWGSLSKWDGTTKRAHELQKMVCDYWDKQ